MDNRTIQCFAAIAAAGSIRKAAEVLHLAQSALSRRILELEVELAAPLLIRLPRGVSLTAAGEIFLQFARDNLLRSDQMRSEIDALQGLRAGTVRIAAAESFMHQILPQCMTEFHRGYPRVRFEVQVGTTHEISQLLCDSTVELGLTYNVSREHELEIRCSIPDQLVAVVSPEHVLAGRRLVSLADLISFPLALSLPTSPTRIRVERAARAKRVSLQPVLESDSVDLRMNVAARSEVVVIIAKFAALPWLAQRSLVAVRLRGREMSTGRVEVISQRGRRLSVAAEMFQFLIQEKLSARLGLK